MHKSYYDEDHMVKLSCLLIAEVVYDWSVCKNLVDCAQVDSHFEFTDVNAY